MGISKSKNRGTGQTKSLNLVTSAIEQQVYTEIPILHTLDPVECLAMNVFSQPYLPHTLTMSANAINNIRSHFPTNEELHSSPFGSVTLFSYPLSGPDKDPWMTAARLADEVAVSRTRRRGLWAFLPHYRPSQGRNSVQQNAILERLTQFTLMRPCMILRGDADPKRTRRM